MDLSRTTDVRRFIDVSKEWFQNPMISVTALCDAWYKLVEQPDGTPRNEIIRDKVKEEIRNKQVILLPRRPKEAGLLSTGHVNLGTNELWVSTQQSVRSQAITYLHEFGHILQYRSGRDERALPHWSWTSVMANIHIQEIVVESAAGIVGALMGLEWSASHNVYVASYMKQLTDMGYMWNSGDLTKHISTLVGDLMSTLNLKEETWHLS
jgi:hypothetical protein